MNTTVQDLLSLSSLANMQLVGGETGLRRIVSWPYVILCPPISAWVSGGEFLIYYGANQIVECVELRTLVQEAADNHAAALLFLVGEHYILPESVDDSLAELANQLNFPVFTITSRAYVNSITKDIIQMIQKKGEQQLESSYFWYSLFFEYTDTNELSTLNKALFLGYLPNYTYCVYILQMTNVDTYFSRLEAQTGLFSESRSEFYRMLATKVAFLAQKELVHGWHIGQTNSNIFVFSVNTAEQQRSREAFLEHLLQTLATQYPGCEFRIGKGLNSSKLSGIRQSFIQAKRSLLAASLLPKAQTIVRYQELGFYQLLFEIPNAELVRQFASSWLEALLSFDQENHSHLYETLCCYLENRCNKVQTAAALYLHRNTLLNRLERIEQLIPGSLEDSSTLFHLEAAIRIRRFLSSTEYN